MEKQLVRLFFCFIFIFGFVSFAPWSVASAAYFSVGSGFVDNLPHQMVRTDADKVYVFAGAAQYNTNLKVYWTTGTGIPSGTASFNGSATVNVGTNIISVDAVYGGGTVIHVLYNLQDGTLYDRPFDTSTNTFKSAIQIASGNPTLPGDYLGSQGVSGMFDSTGRMHIAYWSSGNHITYRAYTYNGTTNVLSSVNGPTQIDDSGSANHPQIAVSPADQSVTIAWVSQATTPAKILVKSSATGASWGSAQTASAVSGGDPWVSDNFGKNIDQGPSVLITKDGKKHLLYMETFDSTGDYGRMHYSTTTGTTWTDYETNFYSHAAALATNSAGDIYMFGHGHPNNTGSCTSMSGQVCSVKRNADGTWGTPQVFATAPSGENFDGSASIKWSAVSWNRPESIELLFFEFSQFKIYYASIVGTATATPTATASPTASPTVAPTATPTSTPIPTSTPSPTVAPTASPSPSPTASPVAGDANGDGKLDLSDFVAVITNYLKTLVLNVDLNNDGKINSFDYAYVYQAYTAPTPTPSPSTAPRGTVQPSATATVTPAPTTGATATNIWTQDGHDAQRTSYTKEEPLEPWTFKWSWNGADSNGGTGNHAYNAPNEARTVMGGGKIYVPAGLKGIYALSLTRGNVASDATDKNFSLTSVRFNAAPVYDPAGYIYVGASNGFVYKLNATDLTQVASYNALSSVNKAALLVGSSLYVVSDNGVLHKINTATMTGVWTYTAGSTVATLPSYSATRDIIIYATDDLYVHAVKNADGTRKWRVKPSPNNPGDPAYPSTITYSGSPVGNQFDRGYPVVADKTGAVFVRMQLPHDLLFGGPNSGRFGSTNDESRTWLVANPSYKNLFALNLDDGTEKFVPAVGYGSTEDLFAGRTEGYGVMGTQPVVKDLGNGKEVAYIQFRSAQTTPTTDFRWSGHMGEMVLDSTTVSGYNAGDMRFLKMNSYSGYGGNSPTHIVDEQDPLTVAGNTLLYAHWAASTSVTITNRADSLGGTYANPITTSLHPPIVRALQTVSCKDATTRWTSTCTNLNYVTDGGRYFNGPGWWQYFGVADPPGWRSDPTTLDTANSMGVGTSYSSGFLPRYTYVSNGYIVVEGNGGDILILKHSGTALQ